MNVRPLRTIFYNIILDIFERKMAHVYAAQINSTKYSPRDAQRNLYELLHNLKKFPVLTEAEGFEYHCTFLMSLDTETFWELGRPWSEYSLTILDQIGFLAKAFYNRMAGASAEMKERAEQALRSMLPDVYDTLEDKSYASVVHAYAASRVPPREPNYEALGDA